MSKDLAEFKERLSQHVREQLKQARRSMSIARKGGHPVAAEYWEGVVAALKGVAEHSGIPLTKRKKAALCQVWPRCSCVLRGSKDDCHKSG